MLLRKAKRTRQCLLASSFLLLSIAPMMQLRAMPSISPRAVARSQSSPSSREGAAVVAARINAVAARPKTSTSSSSPSARLPLASPPRASAQQVRNRFRQQRADISFLLSPRFQIAIPHGQERIRLSNLEDRKKEIAAFALAKRPTNDSRPQPQPQPLLFPQHLPPSRKKKSSTSTPPSTRPWPSSSTRRAQAAP